MHVPLQAILCLAYLCFFSSYLTFYKIALEISVSSASWNDVQLKSVHFASCWWEILREPIEGWLEIVNTCPCNPISHAKGNWELTLGYQLSCELSQKWHCRLKKMSQSPEMERSSEFIFDDSWTLSVKKQQQNLKRLRFPDPVTWRIFSFCYFNMTFVVL